MSKGSHEVSEQQIERKLREVHEYARHIFQQVIVWFAFFAGVNYATMGWLAKAPAPSQSLSAQVGTAPVGIPPAGHGLIWAVSILFVTQNALGIAAALITRRHFLQRADVATRLDAMACTPEVGRIVGSSMPVDFYVRSSELIAAALVLILLSWCVIPFLVG